MIPRRSTVCRTSHARPDRSLDRTSRRRWCRVQACLVEKRQQTADALIDGFHATEVIVQVALIFPADEVFALELGSTKCRVAGLVIGVPGATLFRGQNRRRRELQIDRVHRAGNGHVLVVLSLAAAGVVVKKTGGLRVAAVGVVPQVAQRGQPLAMRRLVLAHEQERLRLVSLAQPVEAQVGDDVGRVTVLADGPAVLDHRRMIIDSLPRQNLPIVEAGRVADQVPLAEESCLVARGLQQLGKGSLRAVKAAVGVVKETVSMRVLAGQNRGPAGAADGVGHDTPVESHSFAGQAIDVGRLDQLPRIVVGTDGLKRVIITENKNDVRPASLRGLRTSFRADWDCGCSETQGQRRHQHPRHALDHVAHHDLVSPT